jgi:hypothetical protein
LRTRQKRQGQQTAIRSTAVPTSGRFKMSEVIEHLAEPLIDELGDSPERIERIIMMTTVGWNLTLFPPQERDEQLKTMAKKMFPDDDEAQSVMSWVCDLVAERKQKYYPNLKNLILDVHFEREPDNTVYFEVAYCLEESSSP